MRDKELLGEHRLLEILSHSPVRATTTAPPPPILALPTLNPPPPGYSLLVHQVDKVEQDDGVLGRLVDHTSVQPCVLHWKVGHLDAQHALTGDVF